jgi:membrane protein implicated in regulation of membrane protease activity
MFSLGIALLIAGALMVVAEIHSFTVYLLAVAAACFAAGGLAVGAHTGLDTTLTAFGLVLLAGLPAAHVARRRLKNPESDRISRDDVGAAVRVVSMDNGTLRVSYRGAEWDARPAPGLSPQALTPGERLTIVERDGSTLVVAQSGGAPAGA